MEPTFVTIWEATSSDGYTERDTGRYYADKNHAGMVAQKSWGSARERTAIDVGGSLYLVESKVPVVFADDLKDLKETALKKLSPEEKAVLGLSN